MDGRGSTTLSTLGLKEVYDSSEKVIIDDNFEFKVTSLPGLCILKLIAYSERPAERVKDIQDINFIIGKYVDINMEYICDRHFDIIDSGWNENLSARVLGRDMKTILNKETELKTKILEILNDSIKPGDDSKIAQLMTSGESTLEDKIEVLKSLRDGICDFR